MDTVKFVPMLVGLLLAVVMVGAVFVPVISSSTTRTVTTEIENEGAGWLALGYNEGTDYSFTVGFETVTVEEVETEIFTVGTQTGDYEDMICYADPQRTLFVSGDYWYLLTNGESPSVHKFTDTASVTKSSGTLTILDGSETVYTGASPTWAYVPDANGVYGFFTEGGLNLEGGKPTVAVGSYAGVFAYNNTVVAPNGYGDLGLTMSGNYADGEVTWIVVPSELDSLNLVPIDNFNPSIIDLDPIDIQPIDLGGSGSVGLMAVPTPTYTDGYWGFDLDGTNAKIVSYSGPSGNIVVPSSVTYNGNSYPVTIFGKGGNNNTVFDSATIQNSTLTLPDGLISISSTAVYGCSGFTGQLVIPETVTTIGQVAFRDCSGFTGQLVIPENVQSIGIYAFGGCPGFNSLVINAPLTSIPDNAFSGDTNLVGSLVIPETVTSIGKTAFANTGYTGTLLIPENVQSIGMMAFLNTGFDSLIVAGSPTINSSGFSQLYSVSEVLNLGDTEITRNSYGLTANSVQDHVNALGYVAPTSIHESEVVPIDSPVAGLMQMLPLIAGVGALLLAVGTMIYTRF